MGSTALMRLALFERQQIDHGLAARAAARLRQLEHALPVDLAAIAEAQDGVVRVRDEELLDEVFVLHRRGRLAAAAAALHLVFGDRLALGVTRVRQRDHHVLRLDEVFGR